MTFTDYSIAIGVIVTTTIILLLIYRQLRRKRAISKPLCLQVSDITCDSVSLKWIKPKQGGNLVTSYTIFYRTGDDSQWQSKWISKEERLRASGLSPKACYIFKVRPECGRRERRECGEESDFTEQIETEPKYPGKPCSKPVPSVVTQKSITLNWGEPEYGADLVKKHTVLYCPTQNCTGDWKKITIKGNSQSTVIDGLHSEMEYSFKVCYEGDLGSSPESELSDPVMTDIKLLSERIKEDSELTNTNDSSPKIYKLPMKHVGGQKYALGEHPSKNTDEKVLMLVGATGTGKTTLLNSIANYILGVRLEDDFRFKVDITDHDQASAYTFYPMDGSQLSYTLTIIDTPGLDNGRGIKQDKTTVSQLHNLLSTQGEQGIPYLNGVAIVAQSSKTLAQKLTFDSILGMFGKNISSNMFLMITFTDDHNEKPPVINTAKEAGIPYNGNYYVFSNSILFSKPLTNVSDQNSHWDILITSLQAFFDKFSRMEAVGVMLTKDVLTEWQHLDTILQELRDTIASGLRKISELHEAEGVLKEQESEMKVNQNYTYNVTHNKNETVESPDKKALNCRQCFVTCQYPCDYDKQSLGDTPCSFCPSKCQMKSHFLQNFRYKLSKVTETRTNGERKQKFLKAKEGSAQTIDTIDRLKKELSSMQQDVTMKIHCARKYKQRLNDIALKSSKHTEIDHIDIMIQSEITEKSDGYLDRLAELRLKKTARLLAQLNDEDSMPPKEFSEDWWASNCQQL